MQDSLSNLAAGMMILINRPYDVGDLVEIGGVFGKVENMSMVSTSMLTVDNQKLVVPNSKIWGDVIKNVTDQHIRRVDMVFGISYSDDIPQAERVLNEILDRARTGSGQTGADGAAAHPGRIVGGLHRASLGEDRGLLGRLLGRDPGGQDALRRRGDLHPVPAARRAPDPGRATAPAPVRRGAGDGRAHRRHGSGSAGREDEG